MAKKKSVKSPAVAPPVVPVSVGPGGVVPGPGGGVALAGKGKASIPTGLIHADVILTKITEGKIVPSELSQAERIACVAILREEGWSVTRMSKILDVVRQTIYNDIHEIRRSMSLQVETLDLREYVGEMIESAQYLYSKAMTGRDFRLAWSLKRELMELLRDFGYLLPKPRPIDKEKLEEKIPADKRKKIYELIHGRR